ncbi:MAG: hypothetical protein COX30_04120 [Candidatus Moranbacteria bacterium CG23_combo_of_CG06-09_8_20_14_all_39_10]|nr:MAG: hypothetical protein COX30_04120 [Candidatus Moranbacteria bacterium CG23_combo_of_CG06-09_8_20_14_all_39_10]
MNKKTFEKEIGMCRELFKKQKGCNWGKCQDCAVIPLLYKLYEGEVVEDKREVKKLKDKILKI